MICDPPSQRGRYDFHLPLETGDTLTIPEFIMCSDDVGRLAPLTVYTYLLGSFDAAATIAAGCRVLSHNKFLASNFGARIPEENVLEPYTSPSIVARAKARAGLSASGKIALSKMAIAGMKSDLLLVDNDAFPTARWKGHKLNQAEAALGER